MSKPKLCIIGDSFGCGEWSFLPKTNHTNQQKNYVSHPGLKYFLHKDYGYDVSNYSYGGATMNEILQQAVRNKLQNCTLIVFATDSCRGILEESKEVVDKLYVYQGFSIPKIHRLLFLEWIKNLKSYAEPNHCDVLLIGGHANLYDFDCPDYMKIVTKSWLSEITKQDIGNMSGLNSYVLEDFIAAKELQSDRDKKDIIEIMTQRSHRMTIMKNDIRNFNDEHHPNRNCHKNLAKKIIGMIG